MAIALQTLGPQAGIHLRSWQRDRAGWEPSPSLGGRRITPDGRALVTLVDPHRAEEVDATLTLLLEMDRDTETLARLGTTFRSYLGYALHAEQPRPALLVLTTTPQRVERILATAVAEGAAEGALLVGVSPDVDDPAPAVLEPVWRTERRPEPHTLRELLLYRIRTEAADKAERAAAAIEQTRADRRNRVMRLRAERRPDDLGAALLERSQAAVEAWVDAAPEVADALLEWDGSEPIPPLLAAEAERLRAQQREALLEAADAARLDDPRWRRAARMVTAGRLVPGWLLDAVAEPLDRTQAQARLLGDYVEQRQQAVRAQLAYRPRRRRTDAERARFEQLHDVTNLRGCAGCGLLHRRRDPDRPRNCEHCGGAVVPLDELAAAGALEPVADLLRRLAEPGRLARLPSSYNPSQHPAAMTEPPTAAAHPKENVRDRHDA